MKNAATAANVAATNELVGMGMPNGLITDNQFIHNSAEKTYIKMIASAISCSAFEESVRLVVVGEVRNKNREVTSDTTAASANPFSAVIINAKSDPTANRTLSPASAVANVTS